MQAEAEIKSEGEAGMERDHIILSIHTRERDTLKAKIRLVETALFLVVELEVNFTSYTYMFRI